MKGECPQCISRTHSRRLFGEHLKEWLVTAIDINQLIVVVFAMSSGCITLREPDAVQITAKRTVNGTPGIYW